MIKKTIGALFVFSLVFAAAGTALAARNPAGTGQPGAPLISCGSGNATVQPPGLLTEGFAHATTVYAGSPGTPSALNANSPHAISQYDIACYQQTVRASR